MTTRMIRKQFSLEPEQYEALKRLVDVTGVSEAEIIRRALLRYLTLAPPPRLRAEAWARIQSHWAERDTLPEEHGEYVWRREDAYEEHRFTWPPCEGK